LKSFRQNSSSDPTRKNKDPEHERVNQSIISSDDNQENSNSNYNGGEKSEPAIVSSFQKKDRKNELISDIKSLIKEFKKDNSGQTAQNNTKVINPSKYDKPR